MNIKSLLIGSAAATVAATGAQAADPIIVPEPEPMEYVRVCDVYGAGFFYIPGTETCLNVGGYARYQIDWDEGDDGWKKMARGTINVDARSETEYGTLRGYVELRAQTESGFLYRDDVDDYVRLQAATISLGGLSMGLDDTLYDAGLSGEFDDGGGDRVHFISYTFDAANGVYATVALEEADYNEDYTPNVVGNIGVAQGWGTFDVWGAYDATAEEGAVKAIAAVNATEALTLELMGIYETGMSFYSAGAATLDDFLGDPDPQTGYEWSVGGFVNYDVTPRLGLGVGGQYFADDHVTGDSDYAIGAVADYEIVENFDAKLAVNYEDGDSFEDDDDNWNGFLRFTRSF